MDLLLVPSLTVPLERFLSERFLNKNRKETNGTYACPLRLSLMIALRNIPATRMEAIASRLEAIAIRWELVIYDASLATPSCRASLRSWLISTKRLACQTSNWGVLLSFVRLH